MPRLPGILDRLQSFYGLLPSPPRDPFILFVWEVLSARTTPRKRDAALGALKRLRALTPDSMSRAPQKKLEESVALAGSYADQRLRALRAGVDTFRRHPDLPSAIRGPIVAARRALKGLPQMGEGGASRLLLFAAEHAVMPVDVRISRVASRLGYVAAAPREEAAGGERAVRLAIERELPREAGEYRRAFVYLDHHGAATCTEGDPHCGVCPLVDECPEGQRRVRR